MCRLLCFVLVNATSEKWVEGRRTGDNRNEANFESSVDDNDDKRN
jgi:hypothetical protein